MYVGPVNRRPQFPMTLEADGNNCSRREFLAMRDAERKFREQMKRCNKRRTKPGFETIDNMRYGG